MLRDTKARKTVDEQMEGKVLFWSMPPPEAFRSLVSLLASRGKSVVKLTFCDLRRAHFCGRLDREVFAEMPPELCDGVEGGTVAKLKKELVWIARCKTTSGQSLVRAWTSAWQEQ